MFVGARHNLLLAALLLVLFIVPGFALAATCEELFKSELASQNFVRAAGSRAALDDAMSDFFWRLDRRASVRGKILILDDLTPTELLEISRAASRASENFPPPEGLEWKIEIVAYSKRIETLLALSQITRDVPGNLKLRFRFEQMDLSDPMQRRRANLEHADLFLRHD